uniref:Putative Uncharacterized conserved protein n=2 Tax=Cupriavidus TaxID=106589 RepID=Q46NB4_CUPPJ
MRDRTVEIMWQAIDALDFSRIKAKLSHQKQVQWTPESLESAEAGYRQFLKMAAKYPGVPAVPSEQVDAFWHAHILDTRRYASDCVNIFGHVLHHDPYVGIDGPEDEARLFEMAAQSDVLSMREFGSPLTSASYFAQAAADEPAYCAREATAAEPAYCARMAKGPSYCARMGKALEPAYCAREATANEVVKRDHAAGGQAAYCALTLSQPASC